MYGILYGTEAMNGGSVSVSSRLQITSMYKSVKRGENCRAKFEIWLAASAKKLLRHGGKNENCSSDREYQF